jgi:protocatechuate 3,4-dioxygenase beta subunit
VARPGERFLRLTALAQDTGQPIPEARVALNVVSGDEWLERYDLATDERGVAAVPYPGEAVRIDVGVLAWGWAARYLTWVPDRDGPIPADYTLRLERTGDTMGGWIRDGAGQPVADAEVVGRLGRTGDASNRETPRERFGFQGEAPLARTDRNGFWTAGVIPRASHEGFQLWARHPGFSKIFITTAATAGTADEPSTAVLEPLWSGQWVTQARRGVTLMGRVLDEAGTPLAGARIVHAPFSLEAIGVETSVEGWFAVPGLEPGSFNFTVTAAGFAPRYQEVILREDAPPEEIRLEPGSTLRIRVVDEAGAPVPDATVGLEQWGTHRHKLKWAQETDGDGGLVWDSAPGGVDLDLYARKAGWCYTRDLKLQADGREHTIVMRPALTVTGRVIDADDGQPVLAVKAFPGYGTDEHCWERLDTRRAHDGTFKVVFAEKRDPWRIRVEADGYAPFVSEELKPDLAGLLDVQMKRLDPATAVSGLVLQPDGQPAAGVEVALLTLEHSAVVQGTRFARSSEDRLVVQTDAAGRFGFPPDGMAHTAVAVGDPGFALTSVRAVSGPVTLRLQAWGRIEGVVDASARERPVESVVLEVPIHPDCHGRFEFGFPRVAPGDDGRFTFERVPPIPMWLQLNPGVGQGSFHHQTPVTVAPGATTRVVIATTGVWVTGRLVARDAERDWTKDFRYAFLHTDEPALPLPPGLSDNERKLWLAEHWNSAAGRAQAVKNRSVTMVVGPDGSLRSNAPLPPGAYRLRVTIGRQGVERPVIIPESSEAGIQTFDLGLIPIPTESPDSGE